MRIHSDLSEWQDVPPITLHTRGDLKVQGWERREFEAETADEDPTVELSQEKILIDTREDLIVRLPVDSNLFVKAGGDGYIYQVRGAIEASKAGGDLKIESSSDVTVEGVGGDLYIHGAEGNVVVTRVGGNFKLENAADVQVEAVGGDLHIHHAGAVSARKVGGDANITEVSGPAIVNAGGDLRIRQRQGEVTGNAGGNANVEIQATASAIRLNAKGDIRLHLSQEASARVRAVCAGDLNIDSAEEQKKISGPGVHTFELGGGDGSFSLVAGGDVSITSAGQVGEVRSVNRDFTSEIHQDMAHMGEEMGRLGEELGAMGAELGRDFGSLGQKIAEKISRKLRQKMEKHMQKSSARTSRAGREGFSFNFQTPEPPRPPRPPSPPRSPFAQEGPSNEPVSDEERMLILQMVEEGKITADEAEKLLAALEGNYSDG
jgi:hypothetical protein